MDAEGVRDGQEHRREHHDHRQRIRHEAAQEDEERNEQQGDRRVRRDGAEERTHALRDVVQGQEPREGHRDADQHRGRPGEGRGTDKRRGNVLPRQLAVNEQADEQRPEYAHFGGFGGSEHAPVDAAKDDRRGRQRPLAVPDGLAQADNGELFVRALIAALLGDAVRGDAHKARQHEAGDKSGHEQPGDGCVCHDAVNDHRVARRDQDAERAARGGDGRGVVLTVSGGDHAGDHDAADGGCGGGAGAAERREDHAGEDGHHGEAAADVAHRLLGDFNDFTGNPGGLHEEPGHHETDGGDERELVHARVQVLGDELHRKRHPDHRDDGRKPDNAEQRQAKQHEEDE